MPLPRGGLAWGASRGSGSGSGSGNLAVGGRERMRGESTRTGRVLVCIGDQRPPLPAGRLGLGGTLPAAPQEALASRPAARPMRVANRQRYIGGNS